MTLTRQCSRRDGVRRGSAVAHSDCAHVHPLPVRCVTVVSAVKGWVPNYLRLGPHFIVSLPLAEFIRVKLGAESL